MTQARGPTPAVSVIVPARDAAATISDTLAGLAEQTLRQHFEVIVVDDGSRDSTPEIARSSPVVTRVLHGAGEGPALARNVGVSAAGSTLLAFTDSDCRPSPGWLEAGLSALAEADLVQGAVHATPGVLVGPFDRTLWVTRAWGLFESANLFVRRDLFERLGGFESVWRPRRGTELGEDLWFGWRARRAGARTDFCDAALVHHAVHRRGMRGFVAERLRLRFFPAIARRVPELREDFFFRRYFLSSRSAAFDAALAGALAALALRRWTPLVGVAPYAVSLRRVTRGWGRRVGPVMALGHLVADAVGAVSLARGSIAARSLLL